MISRTYDFIFVCIHHCTDNNKNWRLILRSRIPFVYPVMFVSPHWRVYHETGGAVPNAVAQPELPQSSADYYYDSLWPAKIYQNVQVSAYKNFQGNAPDLQNCETTVLHFAVYSITLPLTASQ